MAFITNTSQQSVKDPATGFQRSHHLSNQRALRIRALMITFGAFSLEVNISVIGVVEKI